MMSKSQTVAQDVAALLRARNPLLWVVTREEARVEKYLFEAAAAAKYQTRFWDIAAGVTDLGGTAISLQGKGDPDGALDVIRSNKERCVWVMRDLPVWISPPIGAVTLRSLRNVVRQLPSRPREEAQAIIVISPSGDVPAELSNHATVIDWPLPDRDEIAALLDATVASLPKDMAATAVNGSRDAVIDAAVGLSGEEAQSCFARSLVRSRRIDPAAVAAEKERAIRSSGLEWVKPIPGGMDTVGGLDVWKQWAVSRAIARTPAARAYGLPMPKGALLVGVPGCGKTLSGNALASEWRVPCLKLDLGALKGKYVGQSEGNLREAFSKIDAIGPCVLIVDEIEKSLAGASGDAGDGGVAADALGALLSWMNDRQSEAFVIATANNIDRLPPELLRKGRFDEVWWIGLPTRDERHRILAAALRSHKRSAAEILGDDGTALDALLDITDQFSGAEIAALIPEAMFAAFSENAREITIFDILTVAKSVKPKGTDKKRPEFAREATSSTQTPVSASVTGRVLDL